MDSGTEAWATIHQNSSMQRLAMHTGSDRIREPSLPSSLSLLSAERSGGKALTRVAGLGADEEEDFGHVGAQAQDLLHRHASHKACCTCIQHSFLPSCLIGKL